MRIDQAAVHLISGRCAVEAQILREGTGGILIDLPMQLRLRILTALQGTL